MPDLHLMEDISIKQKYLSFHMLLRQMNYLFWVYVHEICGLQTVVLMLCSILYTKIRLTHSHFKFFIIMVSGFALNGLYCLSTLGTVLRWLVKRTKMIQMSTEPISLGWFIIMMFWSTKQFNRELCHALISAWK